MEKIFKAALLNEIFIGSPKKNTSKRLALFYFYGATVLKTKLLKSINQVLQYVHRLLLSDHLCFDTLDRSVRCCESLMFLLQIMQR